MAWFLLGMLLTVIYFGCWFAMIGAADADDAEMRRYERQRAEFERWLE